MYKTTGLTHLINSTKYSLQGLKSAFKNERSEERRVGKECR